MAEANSEREMQTKPLTPTPNPPLATLHIMAHLYWVREAHDPLEKRQADLLNFITDLHERMNAPNDEASVPLRTFLLGGQTIILEDLAVLRPDLVTLLVIYNAGGRLEIGPYYVTVDETLVGGESIVRNLLRARNNAEQYGIKLMPVVYSPEAGAHPAQLPQILRAFSIDAAFVQHSAGVPHLPFRWEAPDGSSILVINHADDESPAVSVQSQRRTRPDGPFLWLYSLSDDAGTLNDMIASLNIQIGLPLQQSTLREYVGSLRRELPDSVRPSIGGELRLQALRENAYLHPGTLSARLYLKQRHMQTETRMLRMIEPWLTVALPQVTAPRRNNLLALLRRAWGLILQNQARLALGGNGSDATHAAQMHRYRQIHDILDHLEVQMLATLPGELHQPGQHPAEDMTFIQVWNPLNWPRQQVIEIQLDLPAGKHPARLSAAHAPDDDVLFGWRPETKTLIFLADLIGLGHTGYRLDLSDDPPGVERHGIRRFAGRVIAKTTGETLSVADGKLNWRHADDTIIEDVLRFVDGGDAGDTYNYSPPEPDVIVQADLIDNVEIESTPIYERLIITHRMRIAPALSEDRGRDRGLRLLQLTTTATLYEHLPGIYFHTQFENTAKDHRLRVHLKTGVQSDTVTVDSPFALTQRPAALDGPSIPPRPNTEGVINTQPMQTLAAVQDDNRGMVLLASGLPEYEAIPTDDGLDLALTLVRSVGWLCRDDLRTRPVAVAPVIETPDAQCLQTITADYALVGVPSGEQAGLLQRATAFTTPVQAYQYDQLPPDRPRRSFLSIVSNQSLGATSDGDGAILTAFKPPENGNGWILRLFNPLPKPVEVYLTPYQRPERAYLVTMSETMEGYIDPDANGSIAVTVNPYEIVTLWMTFEPRE
jgi:mannosylglycerate hydrolase